MPKKPLEDLLNKNTELPEVKVNAKRQAVFLAYWEEIESAYAKGWSYIDIWQALTREGVIDFGYSTFMHYKEKMKRRTREMEKRSGTAGDPKGEAAKVPADPQRHPQAPGGTGTKVEMPTFGKPSGGRDIKRF